MKSVVLLNPLLHSSRSGGVGEPVLAEGMFAYIDADDSLYYYNGSAWEVSGVANDSDQIVLAASLFA